jgi:hypothetical protein
MKGNIIKVSKNEKLLGEIIIHEDGRVILSENADSELVVFFQRMLSDGIPEYREIYDAKSGTRILQERIHKCNSEYFINNFPEFLMANGYKVEIPSAGIDELIRQLLKRAPEVADKKTILDNLQKLSYLEKSIILESLNNFFNQNDTS